jgi:hypothetical protein
MTSEPASRVLPFLAQCVKLPLGPGPASSLFALGVVSPHSTICKFATLPQHHQSPAFRLPGPPVVFGPCHQPSPVCTPVTRRGSSEQSTNVNLKSVINGTLFSGTPLDPRPRSAVPQSPLLHSPRGTSVRPPRLVGKNDPTPWVPRLLSWTGLTLSGQLVLSLTVILLCCAQKVIPFAVDKSENLLTQAAYPPLRQVPKRACTDLSARPPLLLDRQGPPLDPSEGTPDTLLTSLRGVG